MKITSLSQLADYFRKWNEENNNTYGLSGNKVIKARITFTKDSFTKEYDEVSRTYETSSDSGKAFYNGMNGYSIFANCLDGTDQGVRLDWFRENYNMYIKFRNYVYGFEVTNDH